MKHDVDRQDERLYVCMYVAEIPIPPHQSDILQHTDFSLLDQKIYE
jgi:hypothetical protein